MPNQQKTIEAFDKIIQIMQELRKDWANDTTTVPAPKVSGQSVKPIIAASAITETIDPEPNLDKFEALKQALLSDRWPEAVNPHLICSPESVADKQERGRGILELNIQEDMQNSRFLDFGCGEGYCAMLSTDYGTTMSVGYDIKPNNTWSGFAQKPNLLLTSDFSAVRANGPYDTILIFDVLDHVIAQDPSTLLSMAREVLTDKGKIYMRTHPFTSRHATHLYHELNKAYVHLVFTPQELKLILPESKYEEPNIGVTTPIVTYESYIKAAGLKIQHRRDIVEKLEPFFKIPKIAERIIKHTNRSDFPSFQLTVQFLDYLLVKE